jgi:hypothetical protein
VSAVLLTELMLQLRDARQLQARCVLHGGSPHGQAVLPHTLYQAGRVMPPLRPSRCVAQSAISFSPSRSLCYSADDLEAARSYYSMSLQLKPNGNLRAAWGLALATSHQQNAHASKDHDANVDALNAIAIRTLRQHYDAAQNTQLSQVVQGWASR